MILRKFILKLNYYKILVKINREFSINSLINDKFNGHQLKYEIRRIGIEAYVFN